MSKASVNLFLALAVEHKQRTGHDIFKAHPRSSYPFTCDVCLNLELVGREWQREAEPTPPPDAREA